MSYPDLMLTKAVSLERVERERTARDPYATRLPVRVARPRRRPLWLQRMQYSAARRLVAWGERLQAQHATPAVQAGKRSSTADCFETVQVRR